LIGAQDVIKNEESTTAYTIIWIQLYTQAKNALSDATLRYWEDYRGASHHRYRQILLLQRFHIHVNCDFFKRRRTITTKTKGEVDYLYELPSIVKYGVQ